MKDVKALLDTLKAETVLIKFKHWRTDEELSVIATLNEGFTNSKITQDPTTNTLVIYDMLAEAWTDVRVSTIISWGTIPEE
jgi:hypothetical protein